MRRTVAIVTLLAGFGVVSTTLTAMAVQPTTFPREVEKKVPQASPGPQWKTQKGADIRTKKRNGRKANPALLKQKN